MKNHLGNDIGVCKFNLQGRELGLIALCLFWLVDPSVATETSTTNQIPIASASRDLTELSIEELINIPVTIQRTTQSLSRSPAAISVITQDDIRRSGVTSIPEALRLAPGLEVARVDSHQWAISSRGFNDVFANKLLVMIDGRSVYTPLFSGVFWDVQDTVLEDIDRIEVIRGPGASLWGANAVNGVINIITKPAKETQGTLITAGGGTEERGFGAVRLGAKVNDEVFYRVYAKYFDRDNSVFLGGGENNDDWQIARGGFRIDWQPAEVNLFTLQGDVYGGELGQTFTRLSPTPDLGGVYQNFNERDRIDVSGGNILGRWTHSISDESSFSFQIFYDRTVRDTEIIREDRDTFDVDFQHRFSLGDRHGIVWGGGYRVTSDAIENTFDVALNPDERTAHLFGAFVQDEISLIEKTLSLTLGSKFEHNDFTGFEIQPSGRLLWSPHERHSVWAAVSRAVRTPSRADDDVRLNQKPPFPAPGTIVSILGDRSFDSEELIAYELGYRVQPHAKLSFDLATFYNEYDNLRGLQPGTPYGEGSPAPPHAVVPAFISNNLKGETYGAELTANWQMLDWWRWSANYTYLQLQIHADGTPPDVASERTIEGSSPHHQVSLRAKMDLPFDIELDGMARYVDNLAAPGVSSYISLDLRFGWRPTENLEFSLVGQNLLDSQHQEFAPTFIATQSAEIERAVYAKVTWNF